MRHCGQHLHAIVIEAAQPLLHAVEGVDRDLQLTRPLRRQQRYVAAGAEMLGRDGQLRERSCQPLRRQDGEQEEENGGESEPRPEGGARDIRSHRSGSGGDSKFVVNSSQ